MTARLPPQPDAHRARETERLIAEGGTDIARWAQMQNLATQWDARAQRAASHIPAGAKVLDIGCGAMALKAALKPGCSYTGADIVERAPGALVIDLNRKEFPEGHYDWVTFLGVLEYVHEPAWPLAQAAQVAPRLLLTYCCDITEGQAVELRRGMGWVNELSRESMRQLLGECGWRVDSETLDKQGAHNHQYMFVCTRL